MFVFSNLATSLDGKIATQDRSFFALGTPEDRRQMQRLRLKADAILNGASTLRTFRRPFLIRKPYLAKAKRTDQPVNVVVSRSLEGVSPRWPFFLEASTRRVLIVSAAAPASRIRPFEKSCEIVRIRPTADGHLRASAIVRSLKKLGIQRLLVEGGGGIMWDFARDNLIDEYHVTVTPWIIGGTNAPTLVDGKGFDPSRALKLRLKSCRRVGQELYLVYGKKRSR